MAAWSWGRGLGAAVLSTIVIGIPTDVIDTSWFTRMTPVRWWEYPVLGVTAVLTGLWFAMRARSDEGAPSGKMFGTSVLSALAVGCPICNKVVVGLLGVSGALSVWAPIQPALAAVSLALLVVAVTIRWRRRGCTTAGCAAEPVSREWAEDSGDEEEQRAAGQQGHSSGDRARETAGERTPLAARERAAVGELGQP